jgi:Na+-driven multidrug efflux pump
MITAIICGGCQIFISFEQGAGLTDSLNNIKNSELFNKPGEMETITNFYNDYYAQTRIFAAQYIYIMGGACILCLYSQFITYLVIAEGRQTVVVVAAIFCNGLNILLDFVLIKYGKLAMIGGAVATDIG